MERRNLEMPPRKDPSKRAEGSNVLLTQKEASKKWEKSNPQITIRLPVGAREKINEYIQKKALEEPDNPKYSTDKGRPSFNAFIRTLIEEEMNYKF